MKKLVTILGAVGLLVGAAGCEKDKQGKDGESTEPTGEGAGKTVKAESPPPKKDPSPSNAKKDQPKVTLVSAGSDPKQKLRFAFKQGAVARAELRMGMDMRMTVDGVAPPRVALPIMRSVLEIAVVDVTEKDFTFKWSIIDYGAEDTPGVMPQVMTAMKTQLKQLIGAKGTGKIDHRGINLGATFEMPPGVAADVAQMMDGMRDALSKMSAPLPEEEIGVGGVWKVEQLMVQNGMSTNVTYLYTVKELSSTSVTVKTEVKMTGIPGKVENKLLPPGATMNLESMGGVGDGAMTIAFDNLVPVKSNVDMTSDTKATVTVGGMTQKTDTKMKLNIEMKKL